MLRLSQIALCGVVKNQYAPGGHQRNWAEFWNISLLTELRRLLHHCLLLNREWQNLNFISMLVLRSLIAYSEHLFIHCCTQSPSIRKQQLTTFCESQFSHIFSFCAKRKLVKESKSFYQSFLLCINVLYTFLLIYFPAFVYFAKTTIACSAVF